MEGRQTNDDRRWIDEQRQTRRQADNEKTDRLTDGQTNRKQSELLTVIEVFIWIEGDLDT